MTQHRQIFPMSSLNCLKVFSATGSSETFDILHAHDLCVSYDRILRITQGEVS